MWLPLARAQKQSSMEAVPAAFHGAAIPGYPRAETVAKYLREKTAGSNKAFCRKKKKNPKHHTHAGNQISVLRKEKLHIAEH